MNYLKAQNITKIYGDKVLFKEIDIHINKGQKVALVARNGTGKTSLLNILTGLDSSDGEGSVYIHKDIKLGFLAQNPGLNEEDTVLQSVFYSDNPVLEAIRNYETTLLKSQREPNKRNEENLAKAMDRMSVLNAWDYEAKVKEILFRFNIDDLNQPVGEMSGGERKRVALASVLIQEPDLLIMDEPTNHLDMEMIEWLEDYLSRASLSLLLVTHDRYFLDRVCNQIIELDNGEIQVYRGNYGYFLEKKAEQQFNLNQTTMKAQRLFQKELQWMRTQPKARTTKAKSRVDNFDKIEEKAKQKIMEEEIGFEGIQMSRIGGKTVEMHGVHKSFDNNKILEEFTYMFKRRDRVGIVGKNGAGKTTFVNLITGKDKPDSGNIIRGKTVVFGYYTQSGLNLEEDKKVIDVVRDIAEYLPLAKGKQITAEQLLDRFMFPYYKHENYVSTLSGGEQRRLHLLVVLMQNPNFLILDEPTNDLDLLTLNTLEEFLRLFQGCLIIISHDRYFMDKLVDHVFVFEGNGKVRDYPGNYSQYREAKNKEIRLERERKNQMPKPANQNKLSEDTNNRNKTKTKLSYNEQREFQQLEKEIENLETEKSELTQKLNLGEGSHEELLAWSNRISEVLQLLDEKEDRWLELSEFV